MYVYRLFGHWIVIECFRIHVNYVNSLEKAFTTYSNIYNYTHVASCAACDYFLERAYESQKYVITMMLNAGSAFEAAI